ncbi:hypothetical protein GE061_019726 [Apolygus lucorum]|uniref:Uncharacterized protein n=1 Tax=Apolygus lucorum TaxID=248454 RepID=A0A8S9X9F6_APOLU|nr:hypothetical protein GE061_019726 [Apolygus lucorum]
MGLHEDIGRLLITKGPADLNDAIKILTNEFQFPNLRRKYLEKPKPHSTPNPKPMNHNYPRNNHPPGKPFQKFDKPYNSGGKPPFKNQPSTSKPVQQPFQFQKPIPKHDTPYIPHHLRTKDTMSYQTTLNHELNIKPEEYDEEDSQEIEEDEDREHFLDTTDDYHEST